VTYYEWIVETVEDLGENEVDVIDTNAWDTYEEARKDAQALMAQGKQTMIGLTRNVGDEVDGLQDRQWAYIEDGELPGEFDGGARVPQRFQRELKA